MEKFLLLEDDAALGSGIQLALQSSSVQVTLCRSLARGMDAAAKTAYQLLILDANLPDGSGLELLYTLGSAGIALILSVLLNPLAGSLLETMFWFFRAHFTILPALLVLPIFVLLGCAIPSLMYRQASK